MTLSTTLAAAPLSFETVSPSPSPTDVLRGDLNAYDVTPGLIGFLAIFFIAVVCVLGWFSMNRRVRRLRFAERAEAARATEAPDGAAAAERTVGDAARPEAAASTRTGTEPTPDRSDG